MRDVYEQIDGSVTAPRGFRAAGVACGIKASKGLDLAVIASDVPASAAAVFTTNLAQAAPMLVSREQLWRSRRARISADRRQQRLRQRLHRRGRHAARAGDGRPRPPRRWRCDGHAVLVLVDRRHRREAATMDKVRRGIADAVRTLSADGGPAAARAIMTTDPFPKEAAVEVHADAGTFRVGGIAKGSGMIEPMMATMLGFVTTDAAVEPALLQRALKAVCDDTFNAITVDGECSTNDCVFALANGASGVTLERGGLSPSLVDALRQVCEPLAIGIVRGGEGATKLITVRVVGARIERGCAAGRAGDRQLAAREDRHSRRRSELGPAGRRRGPIGIRVHARTGRGPHRTGRAVQGRHAARRAGAARPPSTCRARTSTSRSISAPAAAAVAHVDVRPHCRVRADQRRVPDVVMTVANCELTEVRGRGDRQKLSAE